MLRLSGRGLGVVAHGVVVIVYQILKARVKQSYIRRETIVWISVDQ